MDKYQQLAALKPTFFAQFSFFVFGVSAISGWNGVLTALDFFQYHFKGFDVPFYFPVPLFVANCIVALLLPTLSRYLSITFRVGVTLFFITAILLILCIIAYLLPNVLGFGLSLGAIFFLGCFNSLQQNSSIGIASILGPAYVSIYFFGTGMSGTIICVFRLITLATMGENPNSKAVLIYFCVAGAWNIIGMFIWWKFTKTDHYRVVIKHAIKLKKSAKPSEEPLSQVSSIQPDLNPFQVFMQVLKLTFPIPICIFFTYIQTFMMFPGLSLEKNFSVLSNTWGSTLLILTFNVADTISKFVSKYEFYNLGSLVFLLILRFGFYATFILIVLGGYLDWDWFAFVNIFVFAFLNGYLTAGFMGIGPSLVDNHWKEKVGQINTFCLMMGIMIGSFAAVPLKEIPANNGL